MEKQTVLVLEKKERRVVVVKKVFYLEMSLMNRSLTVLMTVMILAVFNLASQDSADEKFVKPGESAVTPQSTATPKPKKNNAIKELKADMSVLEKSMKNATEKRQELAKQLAAAKKALDQQSESLDALAVSLQGVRDVLEDLKRSGKERDATSVERVKATENLRMNMVSLDKLMDSLQDKLRQLEERMAKQSTADEKVQSEFARLQDLLQVLRGDISNNDEDIASLRKQMQKLSFDKSKRAGERQNVDRLRRLAKHPFTALGIAAVALIVSVTK